MLQNSVMNERKIDFTLQKPFDSILSANTLTTWLENRNSNITTQLACIFKTFEDFRLVAQIREEIEKVKPSLAFTTL